MEQNIFPKIDLFPRIHRAAEFVKSVLFNQNVQFSASNHYTREHFTDKPVQPAGGLPPARKFEE